MIKKISAHFIFPLSAPAIKFGIIVYSSSGEILEIIDNGGEFREIASLEFFDGILVPGFVNKQGLTNPMMLAQLQSMQNQSGFSLEQTLKLLIFEEAKNLRKSAIQGSFEKNKYPGINLLTRIDYSSMKLTPASELKVILPAM